MADWTPPAKDTATPEWTPPAKDAAATPPEPPFPQAPSEGPQPLIDPGSFTGSLMGSGASLQPPKPATGPAVVKAPFEVAPEVAQPLDASGVLAPPSPEQQVHKALGLSPAEAQENIEKAAQNRRRFDERFAGMDLEQTARFREEIVPAELKVIKGMEQGFLSDKAQFERVNADLAQRRNAAQADPALAILYQGELAERDRMAADLKKQAAAIDDAYTSLKRDAWLANQREYDIKSEKGSFAGATQNEFLAGFGDLAAGFETLVAAGLIANTPVGAEGIWGVEPGTSKDDILKKFRQEVAPGMRGGFVEMAGDRGTSPEYIEEMRKGFGGGAWLGLVRSVPGMATPGMAGIGLQVLDGTMQEMSGTEFEGVPESEKMLVAVPMAAVSMALERFGFKNLASSNPLIKRIVTSGMSKLSRNASAEEIEAVMNKEVRDWATQYIAAAGSGAAAEFETGALQEASTLAMKDIYNGIKGEQKFDTPDGWRGYMNSTLRAGAQEAVGGYIMAQPYAVSKAYRRNEMGKMTTPEQFEMVEQLVKDPNYQSAFEQQQKQDVEDGVITPEQAKEVAEDLAETTRIIEKIPDDFSTETRQEAFDLIAERDKLKKKDPALVATKVEALNEKLRGLKGVPKVPEPTVDADGKKTEPEPVQPTGEEVQQVSSLPDTTIDDDTEASRSDTIPALDAAQPTSASGEGAVVTADIDTASSPQPSVVGDVPAGGQDAAAAESVPAGPGPQGADPGVVPVEPAATDLPAQEAGAAAARPSYKLDRAPVAEPTPGRTRKGVVGPDGSVGDQIEYTVPGLEEYDLVAIKGKGGWKIYEKTTKGALNPQTQPTAKLAINDLRERIARLGKKRLDAAIESALAPPAEPVVEEPPAAKEGVPEKLRRAADALERFKSKPDGTLKSSLLPFEPAWNAAITAAQLTLRAGATTAEALTKALKALQKSDWYRSATDEEKMNAEVQLSDALSEVDREVTGEELKTPNLSTVQKRRLKMSTPLSSAEIAEIVGNPQREGQTYQEMIDAGKGEMTRLYNEHAGKPRMQQADDLLTAVKEVKNPVSKVYMLGDLRKTLDEWARDKNTPGPERVYLSTMGGKTVNTAAAIGLEAGRTAATFNAVYNDFGGFHTENRGEVVAREEEAKLDSPDNAVDGKTLRETINEAREEIARELDTTPELKAFIETLQKINNALREAFVQKILAGKATPLEQPAPLSVDQALENPALLNKKIAELEKALAASEEQLKASKDADTEQYQALLEKIQGNREAIEHVRTLLPHTEAEKNRLRTQNRQLEKKVESLSIMGMIAARKQRPKTTRSVISKVLEAVRSGMLWDSDLSAAFAEAFGIHQFTTTDRDMVQHMSYALDYFSETGQKEMATRYSKKLNDYLDNATHDFSRLKKWAMLIQDMFYQHALSAIGTFFNATGGSTLQSIFEGTALTVNYLLRSDAGLGAVVYGARRWWQENPAAFSKAMHYTSAYDNTGGYFDTVKTNRSSPYEAKVLNGFFRAYDKVRNDPKASEKFKGVLMMVASAASQASRMAHTIRASDAYLTHSLVNYKQAMDEYRAESKKMDLPTTPIASWFQRLRPEVFKKVDNAVAYGRETREAAEEQADKDIAALQANGFKVPAGYRTRRISEILESNRDQETYKMNLNLSRDMLMMGQPDGVAGWTASKLASLGQIKKSDSDAVAVGKLLLSVILPFMRVTGSAVNKAQQAVPLIGWVMNKYGLSRNNDGVWEWGAKSNPEQIRHRMFVSGLLTVIMAGIAAEMFKLEDDEEEGMKLVLDPDRMIDITSSAYGSYQKNEGVGEGFQMYSFRVRRPNGEWGDYYQTRLMPGLSSALAPLGRMSDDIKGQYVDVKGKRPSPKSIPEVFLLEPMNALGEASFNSVGRAIKKWKYADDTDKTSGIVTELMLQPVGTVVQPNIYRDLFDAEAMLEGVPKKERRRVDSPKNAAINALASVYGMDRLLLNDLKDDFGIPIQRVDAVRNWLHGLTDVEKRSLDHPEVALRYKYPGTEMPDKRYRPNSVINPEVTPNPLDNEVGKVYLTEEQKDVVDDLSRALFRNAVLDNYELLDENAKHVQATQKLGGAQMSADMQTLRSEANSRAKDWLLNEIVGRKTLDDMRQKTVSLQQAANEKAVAQEQE